MKKIFQIVCVMLLLQVSVKAQKNIDTIPNGTSVVYKDARIDILGKKMAEYNENLGLNANGLKAAKGYRLMVISTNDRALAMKLRSQLYQIFPDQKQYMSYQMPNIKIKFGNFLEKDDAEKMRKQIMALKLVSNNIYVVPEVVEVKPEKKDSDSNK
ncbi:SPOR domain-containing protein [Ferruginibacter yonginensis]|uniref:SPOR domain-containing protein n=1 Tax=Ferruginibacter yonginensis TaxID=1310416 RepID=A0ABV8QTQ7_9BACT